MDTYYEQASAEFKKDVVARIVKARADGVSSGKLAGTDEDLSIYTIYGALEAEPYPKYVWEKLDEALKKFGY